MTLASPLYRWVPLLRSQDKRIRHLLHTADLLAALVALGTVHRHKRRNEAANASIARALP